MDLMIRFNIIGIDKKHETEFHMGAIDNNSQTHSLNIWLLHDFHFRKMKLFAFRERRRGGEKKSLIAFRKITQNHMKFTALHLHSMLKCFINRLALIYHFLIHKNPLEIPTEKTFHNFTLRISLTTLMLMSLWDFSSSPLKILCVLCRTASNVTRQAAFPRYVAPVKCYVLIFLLFLFEWGTK